MTGVYRACLGLLLVVFLPAIWFVPWQGYGLGYGRYGKDSVITAFLVFLFSLVFSRNAYRCRKCGGILW